MNEFFGFGKTLVLIGLGLAGLGLLFVLGGNVPWLGRLPGDFYFRGKNFSFYFPLATSLLLSVLITIILWLINKR